MALLLFLLSPRLFLFPLPFLSLPKLSCEIARILQIGQYLGGISILTQAGRDAQRFAWRRLHLIFIV
jgi:hypothetical protein